MSNWPEPTACCPFGDCPTCQAHHQEHHPMTTTGGPTTPRRAMTATDSQRFLAALHQIADAVTELSALVRQPAPRWAIADNGHRIIHATDATGAADSPAAPEPAPIDTLDGFARLGDLERRVEALERGRDPEPDPLDENDHRDRVDRDGDRIKRKGPERWANTDMAGRDDFEGSPLKKWADVWGPLAFADEEGR